MAEMVTGKTIRMPCMRRGVVEYTDERILVNQNALEQMSPTAYGMPVVIEHPGKPIDAQSLPSIPVVGRVAFFEYDQASDLWFANFIVDDDEGVKLLQNGYGVSTAWYPTEYTNGGTYNNVSYDRELVSGRYEHLAIVKNPRYEMAVDPVFLNSKTDAGQTVPKTLSIKNNQNNSNGDKKMPFKFWKKTMTEIKANENEELVVELEHGHIPLQKVIEELSSMKSQEAEAEKAKEPGKKVLANEDEVEVEGKKMKVQDLVKEYNALKEKHEAAKNKKNEDVEPKVEPTGKEKASSKDEEKHNEDVEPEVEPTGEEKASSKDEEKHNEEKEIEEKKSNARFNSLKRAYENGTNVQIQDQFISTFERVQMGKSKYGSSK